MNLVAACFCCYLAVTQYEQARRNAGAFHWEKMPCYWFGEIILAILFFIAAGNSMIQLEITTALPVALLLGAVGVACLIAKWKYALRLFAALFFLLAGALAWLIADGYGAPDNEAVFRQGIADSAKAIENGRRELLAQKLKALNDSDGFRKNPAAAFAACAREAADEHP